MMNGMKTYLAEQTHDFIPQDFLLMEHFSVMLMLQMLQ